MARRPRMHLTRPAEVSVPSETPNPSRSPHTPQSVRSVSRTSPIPASSSPPPPHPFSPFRFSLLPPPLLFQRPRAPPGARAAGRSPSGARVSATSAHGTPRCLRGFVRLSTRQHGVPALRRAALRRAAVGRDRAAAGVRPAAGERLCAIHGPATRIHRRIGIRQASVAGLSNHEASGSRSSRAQSLWDVRGSIAPPASPLRPHSEKGLGSAPCGSAHASLSHLHGSQQASYVPDQSSESRGNLEAGSQEQFLTGVAGTVLKQQGRTYLRKGRSWLVRSRPMEVEGQGGGARRKPGHVDAFEERSWVFASAASVLGQACREKCQQGPFRRWTDAAARCGSHPDQVAAFFLSGLLPACSSHRTQKVWCLLPFRWVGVSCF